MSCSFASFWHGGSLSPYERACLVSVQRRGFEVTLYSYAPIANVPPEIRTADARDIVDERFLHGFFIKGAPSLSHFSDLFRYQLFAKTDHIWIDADMLMIRALDIPLEPLFIGNEDSNRLCGAIMRINTDSPKLPTLIANVEAAFPRELIWGETGPRLLTKVFGAAQIGKQAFPPEIFYPLHYTTFWKALLPEFKQECEELCQKAYTVHLWNSVIGYVGIWKRFMPPAGSFLHDCFVTDGTDRFFEDAYPANVMRQMIENWVGRLSGDDLAFRQVLQQLMPGLRRTFNRRKADLGLKLRKVA